MELISACYCMYAILKKIPALWWWKHWCQIVVSLSEARGRFNIKMPSYQYRKSDYGDKTILWLSYLHNGISYTGKTPSLYWIRAWRPDRWCPAKMRHQHKVNILIPRPELPVQERTAEHCQIHWMPDGRHTEDHKQRLLFCRQYFRFQFLAWKFLYISLKFVF